MKSTDAAVLAGEHPTVAAQRRVAVLIPTPPSRHGGGAERVMMSIAAGLADRGVAVDFLVNRNSEDCWGSLSPNVRLLSLDTWRYTCLPGLLKYIRRQRPHGLLSTMKSANLTALVAKKFFAPELRLVIHQANSFSGELRTLSVKQRLALRAIRRLMPSADAIVTLNQAMAADIRELAPKAARNVQVIHDPYDIDEIIARSQRPAEHPWLGDGRTAPVIVAAARLHPKKDLKTLIKAFALVAKQRPVRLVILGEGPELTRLKEVASVLDVAPHVDFTGFKDNPFPFMAEADVFALSSKIEGFGGVLVQAMACGTPVVSTDCPFGPSEILEDGELGRLSPVGDYRAMARSIIETLDCPISSARLREGSRRYSAETSIDAYMDALSLSSAPERAPAGRESRA